MACAQRCIALAPRSMKAHFQLAQAQVSLGRAEEALASARLAHEYCVEEARAGGKGGSSLSLITELVLRCKGLVWTRREEERERARGGLLGDVLAGLDRLKEAEMEGEGHGEGEGETAAGERRADVERKWEAKKEDTRRLWEKAGDAGARRRKVPDWCVDNITFAVMVDPVVVRCPTLPCLSVHSSSLPFLTTSTHPSR